MTQHRIASGNLGDIILASGVGDAALALVDVMEDGSSRGLSYAELDRQSAAIAHRLTRSGLQRGDPVGVLSANRAEYLLAYFGIMRAGMVAVEINHKLAPETVDWVIQDSGCRLIFVDAPRQGQVPQNVAPVCFDDADSWSGFIRESPMPSVAVAADEVCMLLYTSGSSGRPKGVPLTHGGYLWATGCMASMEPQLRGRRALVAAPLFHMNGLFFSKVALRYGATLVLMRRFTAAGYLHAIAEQRCSVITAVPTMLALVARETDALKSSDVSSVTQVLIGSAPYSQGLYDRIRAMFPTASITNSFGTTETGPVTFGPHPRGLPRPDMSLGYPSPFIELKLVGGPTPDEGVLFLKTAAMMKGYHHGPEKTAEKLKDGWYDTGDIVRRDADAFYYYVGRADDMFICGGENIYPGEVEQMLGRHPAVQQVAVVPLADEIKSQVPVAFVVVRPGMEVSEAELKAYALEHGPAYAHPRAIAFVPELPLAGTNKIDRRALIERARTVFAGLRR